MLEGLWISVLIVYGCEVAVMKGGAHWVRNAAVFVMKDGEYWLRIVASMAGYRLQLCLLWRVAHIGHGL